jgi:hypothetical protein
MALILILIAFPSFKLLYLMDEVSDPAMSVLAEGFHKNIFNIYLSLYIPVKVYGNSDVQKFYIYKENTEKSGVYFWRKQANRLTKIEVFDKETNIYIFWLITFTVNI